MNEYLEIVESPWGHYWMWDADGNGFPVKFTVCRECYAMVPSLRQLEHDVYHERMGD